MPSLQIPDLPEHLYEMLAAKAKRHRRSLAQQATVELERMAAAEARARRLQAVDRLRAAVAAHGVKATSLDPVLAVREDRER